MLCLQHAFCINAPQQISFHGQKYVGKILANCKTREDADIVVDRMVEPESSGEEEKAEGTLQNDNDGEEAGKDEGERGNELSHGFFG